MNRHHSESLPEEEIKRLLGQFKPHPSTRYHQRIAIAPWMDGSPSRLQGKRIFLKDYQKIVFGLMIVVLLMLVSVLAFVPSARVTADQVIHFFLPTSSNQIKVQVTPMSSTTILDFSNPANFPLSISEVRGQVKFNLREIQTLPENLTFIGARYEQSYDAVILFYTCNDYKLFLTQRPAGSGQDVFSIGEGANIEMVLVGDHPAEFVQGGWKALSTQSISSGNQTPGIVELNAVWDNTVLQSTLRWQADGMVYEIRTFGSKNPPQSDLIEWANGLK
jgi:hypothetical protein